MPLAFLGNIGPWEWMIILLIVLILFGSTRLPGLARSMGAGVKEFKKGLQEGAPPDAPPPAGSSTPAAPAPPPAGPARTPDH